MVELTLSEIPHSSFFVWSGKQTVPEPGGAGAVVTIQNNGEKDRILFYLGFGNDVGNVAVYAQVVDSTGTGPTGATQNRRNFQSSSTTEGQTTLAGGSGASYTSSAAGVWYNGIVTGNVILWPAGYYLIITFVAATARTHVMEYGYWERPYRGDTFG